MASIDKAETTVKAAIIENQGIMVKLYHHSRWIRQSVNRFKAWEIKFSIKCLRLFNSILEISIIIYKK